MKIIRLFSTAFIVFTALTVVQGTGVRRDVVLPRETPISCSRETLLNGMDKRTDTWWATLLSHPHLEGARP